MEYSLAISKTEKEKEIIIIIIKKATENNERGQTFQASYMIMGKITRLVFVTYGHRGKRILGYHSAQFSHFLGPRVTMN